MKIKTIVVNTHDADIFDNLVNTQLANGYQLLRRDIIPGFPLDGGEYVYHKMYAELVLPDPPAEQETFDPALALHRVQTFCHSVDQNDCGTDRCPLNGWCQRLRDCADPTDWDLSEEVPF